MKFGHSATDRFGAEVQVMRPLALESLVTDMPDTATIRERFEAGVFGEVLGAVPSAGDSDWLVDAAEELRSLLIDADENDQTVLFGFF